MIHQPSIHGNGIQGQVTDIKIMSDHIQKSKERLNAILAENTGKSIEEIVHWILYGYSNFDEQSANPL